MNFDCYLNFTYFCNLRSVLKFIRFNLFVYLGTCENAVCNGICTRQ